MHELREFRARHAEFVAAGVEVAGICRDGVETNRRWTDRLRLPFPVLADERGSLGRELGILRPLSIAGWTIELMRRTTLLAAVDGTIVAEWGEVKLRGHAREVLAAARALGLTQPSGA